MVVGPSSRRGTLQVQQHCLCRTVSSQVCQHCSVLLKSTRSKFSSSFLAVWFLGGVSFSPRMTFFLIAPDCSLETFLHAFPQQLYTVACPCSSAHAFQDRRFPFSLFLIEVGGKVAGASSLHCARQLASHSWRMFHLLKGSNSGGKNVIVRPFKWFWTTTGLTDEDLKFYRLKTPAENSCNF